MENELVRRGKEGTKGKNVKGRKKKRRRNEEKRRK
jgi:hypothetical protein